MQQPKSSKAVIVRLLDAMNATVISYHPEVEPPPARFSDLIGGTAFFPGGPGL
jgi:hypothetical protein